MIERTTPSLYYRQKILLALLEVFGGRLERLTMQKYLFLFMQESQSGSYDFVPYKYGGFSFVSYEDIRALTKIGILKNLEDSKELTIARKESYLAQISKRDAKALRLLQRKHSSRTKRELMRYVYKEYPYYAIRSEMAKEYMTGKELMEIKEHLPKASGYSLFTIGYEGRSFDDYLNQLIKHNIKALCDVRKNPFSYKYGFKKSTLEKTTEEVGVAYHHIPALGIDSAKRKNIHCQKDLNRLFKEYRNITLRNQQESLQSLYALFKKYKRMALTCFEREPHSCHRHIVADALSCLPGWDYRIVHI